MDEITSASTEGTASPSTDVGASSATGADAGQATVDTSLQAATAPETTADEFSAGWSYGDEEAEQQAFPDDDSDLEPLTQEPGLDQEKVPGLVQKIKEIRGLYRDAVIQAKQAQQLEEQFAEYGGVEGIQQMLPATARLILNPAEGGEGFYQQLREQAIPALQSLADTLIERESDYLVAQLQARGLIPEVSPQTAGSIDQDILASLPAHLQELYKNTPADIRNEYDLMTPEARQYMLEREAKLQHLDATQRHQAQQAWHQQVESAKQQGETLVQGLSDQYEKAHFAQFSKWQPFGPEAAQDNQDLYQTILEGAFAKLLADQKYAAMYHDTLGALKGAPMRRLQNEQMAADQDERRAREMAARFNTRLGQVIKGQIQKLDSVFRDARAWREHQRSAAPQRTEIAGQGAQATTNGKVTALNSRGEISDEYTNSLIAGVKQRLSSGG